ncbi:MAG: hypothetical protein WDO73_20405 [Ignavibacteriota bacterium]
MNLRASDAVKWDEPVAVAQALLFADQIPALQASVPRATQFSRFATLSAMAILRGSPMETHREGGTWNARALGMRIP